MDLPSDFRAAMLEAYDQQAKGRLLEAERIFRSLAAPGAHRFLALTALADLFEQQHRLDEALVARKDLTAEDPDNLHFCAQLAGLLDAMGQTDAAIEAYVKFLQRRPDAAIAHFNVARLYAQQKKYAEAIAAYENAIRLDIEQPYEAYSNLGILYSDSQVPDKAREMFERALELKPDYVPAIHNLAGYYEEVGEKQLAIEHYERILTLQPSHYDALARLVYPRKVTAENQDLIDQLSAVLKSAELDNMTRERLYFALGKAFDDLESYEEASSAYDAANKLGKARVVPYDRQKTEQAFAGLIDLIDADWILENQCSSELEPIFICGMFRSGSTLLERMLAAHPAVTAGGEIDVLPMLVSTELTPFPQGVRDASKEQLQRVSDAYSAKVQALYPGHGRLTDKRPDNFLHLGLVKALFPKAKIVHTRRNLADNCLSLYFQQLGNGFSYAADLGDCAHYYRNQERLIDYWKTCPGPQIQSVNYEELVASPETPLRELLKFLGLDWDERILDFHKTAGGPVKTASLWQVREKLHTRSSGRWLNYETTLPGFADVVAITKADQEPKADA